MYHANCRFIRRCVAETYFSQSAFKACVQQSCTKRVIDERSEGLQAFSRHCLFPNRSVNFAQEFHHIDKLGKIQRKRCIPSGWQGCVDRSTALNTISCRSIADPKLPKHAYNDESFGISLSGACDLARMCRQQELSMVVKRLSVASLKIFFEACSQM